MSEVDLFAFVRKFKLVLLGRLVVALLKPSGDAGRFFFCFVRRQHVSDIHTITIPHADRGFQDKTNFGRGVYGWGIGDGGKRVTVVPRTTRKHARAHVTNEIIASGGIAPYPVLLNS